MAKKLAKRVKKIYKKYRNTLLVAMAILVAVGGIFLYYATKNYAAFGTPEKTEVSISSDHLQQSGTLLVTVKGESQILAGSLGLVPLHFFKSEDGKDWVALVGIPVDKKPATYALTIFDLTNQIYKKDITITKRNFPVTPLFISPSLAQKGFTAKKIVTTIVNTENKSLNQTLNIITPNSYITKPFIYPLSQIKVVGDFGDIRHAGSYNIQHLGVDLKAPIGTPVYAVNDGKVVFEENMPDYGNTLVIDHGLGMYSLYLHLSKFNVADGQMVKQQNVIALSGQTGYAIGPHLHFSIKVRGAALDPLEFIKTTQTNW